MSNEKRKSAAALSLACLGWLVAPSETLAQRAPLQVGAGVHVGLGWYPMQGAKQALIDQGLTFRDEVPWDHLETTRGALKFPASMQALDDLVTSAAKAGVRPLLILDYGNKLYGEGLLQSDEQIAAYVRYVRFVVKHFAGRVNQFEVWNEWNFGMGSSIRPRPPGSAADYVAVLKAAAAAIKQENPGATVVGGALALVDIPWVDAFGRAGGFQYIDAFSVHPYEFWWNPAKTGPAGGARLIFGGDPGGTGSQASGTTWDPIPGTPEAAVAKLDLLRSRIRSFVSDREMPIYVTEISWPTNNSRFGSPEPVAAAYLQRFVLLAATRPWIAGIWWHDFSDDGDDPTKVEFRYGLRRKTGEPKPAYDTLLATHCLTQSAIVPTPTLSTDQRLQIAGVDCHGQRYIATWLPTDDFHKSAGWPGAAALSQSGFQAARSATNSTATVSATPVIYVRPK